MHTDCPSHCLAEIFSFLAKNPNLQQHAYIDPGDQLVVKFTKKNNRRHKSSATLWFKGVPCRLRNDLVISILNGTLFEVRYMSGEHRRKTLLPAGQHAHLLRWRAGKFSFGGEKIPLHYLKGAKIVVKSIPVVPTPPPPQRQRQMWLKAA